MASTEPIRKSSLPTTPPPEFEFHTVLGGRLDNAGCMLVPGDMGPVVVRRRVTYGDWEPVRPDHWADEPAAADVATIGSSAPYPDYNEWLVQMLLDDGTWGTWRVGTNLDEARERLRIRRTESPDETFRLVRMTTVHAIEDGA